MERDWFPDKYSKDIFKVLIVNACYEGNRRMRYAEIRRKLEQYGNGMSDSTLDKHLKELKRKKVLTRKRKSRANISYAINLKNFEGHLDSNKKLLEITQTIEANTSAIEQASLDRAANLVCCLFFLRDMHLVKLGLQKAANPDFVHTYTMLADWMNSLYRYYSDVLFEVSTGRKNDEYEGAIQNLDKDIETLMRIFQGKVTVEEALAGKITLNELKKRLP